MSDLDRWAHQLKCNHCQHSMFLPHRTPLGTFHNQVLPAMGAWPADFLCPQCERVFSYLPSMPHREAPPTVQLLKRSSLLRLNYEYDQDTTKVRGALYSTYTIDVRRMAIAQMRKYLQETHEGVRIDPVPGYWPCWSPS